MYELILICIVISTQNFTMETENRNKPTKKRKTSNDDLYQPYKKKTKKIQLPKINKKEIRNALALRLKIKAKQSIETKLDCSKIFNTFDLQIISCSVCLQLLLSPTTLLCGHTFCYSCLKQLVKSHHSETCPLCRTSFSCQILQINRDLDYLLNVLYKTKLSEDEKIKYDSRKKNIEEKLNDENHCINFASIKLKTKLKMKVGNHEEIGVVTNIFEGGSKVIEARSLKDDSIYVFKSSTQNLNLWSPENTILVEDEQPVGVDISSQSLQDLSEISFNQYYAQLGEVELFPMID